jgi:hypothetical protein
LFDEYFLTFVEQELTKEALLSLAGGFFTRDIADTASNHAKHIWHAAPKSLTQAGCGLSRATLRNIRVRTGINKLRRASRQFPGEWLAYQSIRRI